MRATVLSIGLILGCSSKTQPARPAGDYVDLDVVLQVLSATLSQLDAAAPGARGRRSERAASTVADATFCAAFTANLNARPGQLQLSDRVATRFEDAGALIGFSDPDADLGRDPDEEVRFTVHLDRARGRLIAVDAAHDDLARDLVVASGELGLATAYVVGRMQSAQQAAGIDVAAFSDIEVQAEGYQQQIPAARRHPIGEGAPADAAAPR